MQSPSPSPSPSLSPSPPPSASPFQEPTTNGFQDHVTHSGHPARPYIWVHGTPGHEAGNRGSERNRATCSSAAELSLIPDLDINVPSAGAASDENAQIPTEIEARDDPHGTLDFHQESFQDQQILPQWPNCTQVLNNHVQTANGYAQNPKVANLNGASISYNGSLLTPTQDSHHHPVGTQPQPQPLRSLVYHGQAASSAPPYFDSMGPVMANTVFQPYSNNWGHNMAMGSPQAFQNQVYPMDFIPLPMQEQNFWVQDPTQMMQSQMMANFAPIPLTTQVVQRRPCSWPSCTESFTRPSDLQRHIDAVHLGIKYHCFWIGCPNNDGKGYSRAEKLRTHQRQKHGFA